MQKHLLELQQLWQNYERELDDTQKYITSIVIPFLQSATDNITGKDITTQQKMAKVVCFIILHVNEFVFLGTLKMLLIAEPKHRLGCALFLLKNRFFALILPNLNRSG